MLARELGEYGVTVNAVMPSQVATSGTEAFSGPLMFESTMRQQILKEFVRPEDFAPLVAFLASDDGRLVTRQFIVLDGRRPALLSGHGGSRGRIRLPS